MTAGRKPTRSREEFVTAAIEYADEHGISNLSLRSLGSAMGASTTAVYRYFHDKNDLIVAMRETLLAGAFPANAAGDPRSVLMASALGYRTTAKAHPCLSQIMNLPALEGTVTMAVPQLLINTLAELGLSGPLLVRGYRQLESFVLGATAFDFSDAPLHLQDRYDRMRQLESPDIDAVLTDPKAVERNNEAAFLASLTMLLDGLLQESTLTEQHER